MAQWKRGKLTVILILLECVFIVLFGVYVRYDAEGNPVKNETKVSWQNAHGQNQSAENPVIIASGHGQEADVTDSKLAQLKKNHIPDFYAMFQDIHVMMFIGFGFLMTFLKRYGFGSVGFNFLLAAFILQWATLTHGFLREFTHEGHEKIIRVNIVTLINADFAAATVLISFGAVLGKVSILQLIIMALFEVTFFQINEYIVFDQLGVTDVGDSLVVHLFGAYFGLAVSRILYHEDVESNGEKESAVYHSDIFAMIGTIFLWLFWPSFNGATALEEGRVRAVINTYFSLTASTIVTYAISSLVHKEKFSMIHVQNSTLAGGVAVGTVADMIIQPWGAILTGSMAGLISVLGYRYLTPFLFRKIKLHDTCGVHNLHGMPGFIGGVAGIIAARLATADLYGEGLNLIFKEGLTPNEQAGIQAAGLGISLGMALVCGTITGLVLKIPIWNQPKGNQIFDDEDFWLIEDGFPPVSEHEHEHELCEKSEANNNKLAHQSPIAITQFTTRPDVN